MPVSPPVPLPPTAPMASAAPSPVRKVANSWKRFANYLLDGIFAEIFSATVGFFVGILFGLTHTQTKDYQGTFFLLGILTYVAYYVFSEFKWRKTLGKMITGTKVVRRDGTRPALPQLIGRTFARMIPFEPLCFLFTNVGWHDSLSGTLVVPADYTEDDVRQINLNDPASTKPESNIALIAIIAIFGGIFIIGLLSTLAVVALNVAREKARDSHRVADIKQIQTGLELYYADNKTYPDTTGLFADLGEDADAKALCKKGFASKCAPDEKQYLGVMPSPPSTPEPGCSQYDNSYKYSLISPTSYSLEFCLGDETTGLAKGTHTATPDGIQ
jgi:uncharacterized RDD family membrane protein YckC/type II secretory pathway pseudopilin PulG